jgi:hypothetical protein
MVPASVVLPPEILRPPEIAPPDKTVIDPPRSTVAAAVAPPDDTAVDRGLRGHACAGNAQRAALAVAANRRTADGSEAREPAGEHAHDSAVADAFALGDAAG